jgi:hypothetical protein
MRLKVLGIAHWTLANAAPMTNVHFPGSVGISNSILMDSTGGGYGDCEGQQELLSLAIALRWNSIEIRAKDHRRLPESG